MPNSGPSLQAFLVVDNSLLVMLCEYFCDRYATSLSGASLIQETQAWIAGQLDILKQFTPDRCIHCTNLVVAEFNPIAGRLGEMRGITNSSCRTLQRHVRDLLACVTVEAEDAVVLRNLPQAPPKLVGPSGLSPEDFSLVVLALQLTRNGSPVYVLTNDQDLLSFISWMRTRREVRNLWGGSLLLQGLLSLTYLEILHRDCSIQTDQMKDLIKFALIEHYTREDLMSTRKGKHITQKLLEINDSLIVSIETKLAGGRP